jgi:hypothetical protein
MIAAFKHKDNLTETLGSSSKPAGRCHQAAILTGDNDMMAEN